jgi:hypothetical protein
MECLDGSTPIGRPSASKSPHPASFLILSLPEDKVWSITQVRTENIQILGMLQALRVVEVEVIGAKQVFERFMINANVFPCMCDAVWILWVFNGAIYVPTWCYICPGFNV